MRQDRFLRIVNEIKNGYVENVKDRKDFLKLLKEYILKEDKEYFLFFEKKEVKYLNERLFDEFVDYYLNTLTKKAFSKKEEIIKNQNSKKGSLHTTENLIIYRKKNKKPILYFNEFPNINNNIVVVENFESFLKLDFDLFEEDNFIYLGGFGNKFVRKFLKNKNILFFVDFDFFGIEIYNSIECKNKKIFIPSNVEELVKNYGSKELYEKQLFKKENLNIDKNTKKLFEIINKYSKCLEQEIFDVD